MASAVIGALRVNLGIDTAAFSAGLNQATRQLSRVGKQMQSIGRDLSARLTAPIALAGSAIVKASADFEQGMANMAAVLRPTTNEFQALRDMAIDLAQTTKFTAREASDGMEMLARNGIDAANILGGAAKATLDLASAAGASLPSAADAMTDVMVTFRKTGSELNDIVNNIAGTLVNSKMGWDDYVGALGQAAGAAGSLGMSFSDMNAILAATAPAFRNGVEAGTSLKGFLLRMAPSGKQAKDIMAALNLEFFNSQGLMKSAAEIAEELRQKVGGLTKKAQAEVLGALFGQRTIRTALRLMEEGAEGIERFRAKIAEGDAERMAKTRLDTLIGSWNLLRAAAESAAIAIGDSGVLQWARDLVDATAEIARSIATMNPEILKWGTILAGVAAAAGPAILAAGLFAAAIGAIGAPVALAITGVAAVIGSVTAFWNELEIAGRMISNIASDIYNAVKEWLVDKFGWVADGIRAIIDRISAAFQWLADKLGLAALATSLENEVGGAVRSLADGFNYVRDAGSTAAEVVSSAWEKASRQIDEERKTFEGWTKALTQYASMQANVIEAETRRVMGAWSAMAAEMNSNKLLAGLKRASDEIDLGTFGTDTLDTSKYDDTSRLIKRLDELNERDIVDLAREGKRVFEETRTPAEALRLEFERLNELVKSGAIGFDTYSRAVEQAQNEFSGLNAAAENVSQSFGRAFEDMIISGQGWRDTMASLLQDIAREILRLAVITPLMDNIKSGITNAFGSGGGGLGGLFSSLPGFASGGSFQVGGAGGIDSQLVAFRASPNERVTITRPDQERGGGMNITVNVEGANGDAHVMALVQEGVSRGLKQFPQSSMFQAGVQSSFKKLRDGNGLR